MTRLYCTVHMTKTVTVYMTYHGCVTETREHSTATVAVLQSVPASDPDKQYVQYRLYFCRSTGSSLGPFLGFVKNVSSQALVRSHHCTENRPRSTMYCQGKHGDGRNVL